ncbi:MAG: polymerase sigma-B factor [Solirubrobacteraceae bacterium]|jgi:RNA polymerase sigma-B factor|nr:polymerase sigma-B factor [Solirubrobacteraceae bacterium]MEA2358267.1 polymerase sigma-B factor [Solirubrobacteraceae bacterium]MEA2393840.1 polymerase sigma-B factor [Solirubrobacteraceae bacterium]
MAALPATLARRRIGRGQDRDRALRDRALFAHPGEDGLPRDRDAVIERFLPLARQLALRYSRPSEPFDDVYQVACLALIKAVDRYDPTRGVAFSSYAVPTIVGEIKRHYRDRTWAVHVSRDLLEAALTVERTAEELSGRLGRQPTVAELCGRLGIGPEAVLEAREAVWARRATSMEQPRLASGDEDASTLGESLGAMDEGFARAEQRATLASLMRCLSPRDRETLRLRFDEDLTQDEIAGRLGISQMQVSRILRATLERLRTIAAGAA